MISNGVFIVCTTWQLGALGSCFGCCITRLKSIMLRKNAHYMKSTHCGKCIDLTWCVTINYFNIPFNSHFQIPHRFLYCAHHNYMDPSLKRAKMEYIAHAISDILSSNTQGYFACLVSTNVGFVLNVSYFSPLNSKFQSIFFYEMLVSKWSTSCS